MEFASAFFNDTDDVLRAEEAQGDAGTVTRAAGGDAWPEVADLAEDLDIMELIDDDDEEDTSPGDIVEDEDDLPQELLDECIAKALVENHEV